MRYDRLRTAASKYAHLSVRPPYLYLTIFFATGLVMALAVVIPYVLARQTAGMQSKSLHEAAQQARSQVTILPYSGLASPIILGQIGPPKDYGVNLTNTAQNFNPAPLAQPPVIIDVSPLRTTYPARYVARANALAAEQRQLRSNAAIALADTRKLLIHQANVVTALTNLLSYDGSVDFATFDAKSADTKHRLQLAQSGLAATHDKLATLVTRQDPTVAGIIAAIDRLQTARDALSNDGNVAAWNASVRQEQSVIVKNRDAYWKSASNDLVMRLSGLSDQLEAAASNWTSLQGGRL